MNPMSNPLQQQFHDLESSFGLLQRDFEQQNDELVKLARRLQSLEETVLRLVDQIQLLQNGLTGQPSLEDERPPHY